MSSNSYEEKRPRVRVDGSARNQLQWFSNEYGIPLDRVYGYGLEVLAEQTRENSEEVAEEIETNE